MLVGYMRVSTDGDRQVFDLQHDALLAAGVDERHLLRIVSAAAAATVLVWLVRWRSCAPETAWSSGSWTGWVAHCRTC